MRLDDGKVRAASDPAARARHGVSLVAFHGPAKPGPLLRLVDGVLDRLHAALGDFPGLFRPYPMPQVHATIVGLEGAREAGVLVNTNARARERAFGVPAGPMDLGGLVEDLRGRAWPLPIRFGGLAPEASNPYDPRPPWERAFDVREDGLAVLIGWPPAFAPALLELRKQAEVHGVVHKYHLDPAARDNDLFLVLGGVDPGALGGLGAQRAMALAALDRARAEVRGWLERTPVDLALEIAHVTVVEYQSTTLERLSAEWPLATVEAPQLVPTSGATS